MVFSGVKSLLCFMEGFGLFSSHGFDYYPMIQAFLRWRESIILFPIVLSSPFSLRFFLSGVSKEEICFRVLSISRSFDDDMIAIL